MILEARTWQVPADVPRTRHLRSVAHTKAGFQAEGLASARLDATFPHDDERACVATCRLTTEEGKVYEANSSSYE